MNLNMLIQPSGWSLARMNRRLAGWWALVLILGNIVPAAYTTQVLAAGSYLIPTSSATLNGTVLDVSGTSSANPQTGNNNTQHMAVDWDEDRDPNTDNWEVADYGTPGSDDYFQWDPTFTGQGNNRSFTATWDGTHDFLAFGPGTYLVRVMVYHGNTPGEDGDALSTVTFEIVIPPFGNLTVIKNVINDNGGTALASDFTLSVSGGNPDPASFSGSESGTSVTVDSDTNYTVQETGGPTGYSVTYSADCSSSIPAGESRTCTVTNDDIPATLNVIKTVVNNNGGTATSGDFTMNVTGTDATPNSFAGDAVGTQVTLDAGSYSVDEIGVSGYNGSYSADCSGTIGLGETKTCTVTNDDIQPTLTVVKVVDNTNGGTLQIEDFPLFVDLGPVLSGVANGFDAGTYVVTETGNDDYTASFSGACDVDGNVTLSLGDVVTCFITNAYQAPEPGSITVIKNLITDDGAQAEASDFTINVSATNPSDDSFPGSSTGTTVTVDAGAYSITEADAPGYVVSYSEGCEGTIGEGETVTCTITNDDTDTFSVSGQKFNDINGDTRWGDNEGPVEDVVINLWDGDALVATTTTDENGNYSFNQIAPGIYTLCEVVPSGWQQITPSSEDEGVDEDGCYEVTITNADITDLEFGNQLIPVDVCLRKGSISGFVFSDNNSNAIWDEGENPAGEYVVYLDENGNNLLDEGEKNEQSAEDGSYSFTCLDDGTYIVRIVVPITHVQTFPTVEETGEHEIVLGDGFEALAFVMNFNAFQIQAVVGNTATDINFGIADIPGNGTPGGGGNPGGGTPPADPGDTAGDTVTDPGTTPTPTTPGVDPGEVLADTTTLPVTGTPLAEYLLLWSMTILGVLAHRKFELSKK